MSKFAIAWTFKDETQIFTDTVTVDDKLEEAIIEDQDYTVLMLPILYEYSRDYSDDGRADIDLAKDFLHNTQILTIFHIEGGELVDQADDMFSLIDVIPQYDKKPNLHLVH